MISNQGKDTIETCVISMNYQQYRNQKLDEPIDQSEKKETFEISL